MDDLEVVLLTIPTGQSVSAAVDLGGKEVVAVQVPGQQGGGADNYLGFEGSVDGSSWDEVTIAGAIGANSFPVRRLLVDRIGGQPQNEYKVLSGLTDWRAMRWVRVTTRGDANVGGTNFAQVAQTVDLELKLILRPCSIKLSC